MDEDRIARANAEAKRAISETSACEPAPILAPDTAFGRTIELRPEPVVRRVERPNVVQADETYLGRDNWEAVHRAYGQTASVRSISQETNLTRKEVKHILEHGIQRLGLPGIQRYALDLDEIQRIVGRYHLGQESSYGPDPEVVAAVEDRATREVLAAQSALDCALEASAAVHAWIHVVTKRIMGGQLQIPDTVTPALLEKLVKVQEMSSRALDRAVGLSRTVAGKPSNTVLVQVAALVAQCTPEEIAEAARTRTIPSSIRRGSLGFGSGAPEGHSSPGEGVGGGEGGEGKDISDEAKLALAEWEKGRKDGVKGSKD